MAIKTFGGGAAGSGLGLLLLQRHVLGRNLGSIVSDNCNCWALLLMDIVYGIRYSIVCRALETVYWNGIWPARFVAF